MTLADDLFLRRIDEEHSERLTRYKRAWEYYSGSQDNTLAVRAGQPDDNVIVNLTQYIVDRGVSFLFGQEPIFELEEGTTTPAETWLETVWLRNRKMTLLTKLAKSGAIYGHLFVKIIPEGIDGSLPRLVSIEPEYVTVIYDEQDIETVTMYRIEWTAASNGRAIHRRQDIRRDGERWVIENRIARNNEQYQPDPDNPDMDWGYPWPPIVDWQNIPLPGSFYGQSDIENLGLQDSTNYAASKIQRILRYHAHPKTFGSGFHAVDMQINEDDMSVLPSPESKVWNLEMQSDLSAALTFWDKLRQLYLKISRRADLDPAQVNLGAMSGFAIKLAFSDDLGQMEEKRRTYGDGLTELNRRLCDLGGFGPDNRTVIHWQDPLPEDEGARNETDKLDDEMGWASKETIQTRRGLDPETEAERMAQEREAESAQSGNIGEMLVRGFLNGQTRPVQQPPQLQQAQQPPSTAGGQAQ